MATVSISCRRAGAWVLGLAVVLAVSTACEVEGLTFTVDTTLDSVDVSPGDGTCADGSGACSLRAAVMEANASPGGDHIVLAADGRYRLTRPGVGEDAAATGDLDITEGLEIIGAGATVDGGGLDRVFDVVAGSQATRVEHLTITGGTGSDASAYRHRSAGPSILQSVHVTANGAGDAPVVIDGGALLVVGSTFSGNDGARSSGIANRGGTVTVVDATFSGGTGAGAGGIYQDAGAVEVSYSTFAAPGATLQIELVGGSGTIAGSIVDGTCSGTPSSGGHNVESGATCGFTAPDDHGSTDPLLFDLADNGGPVPTHAPRPTSAVIDAGPATCPPTVDARSVPRAQGPACDPGAVEAVTLVVTRGGTAAAPDTNPGDGVCSTAGGGCHLYSAVQEANAHPGTDVVRVSPDLTGLLVVDLSIEDHLLITGVEHPRALQSDLTVDHPVEVHLDGVRRTRGVLAVSHPEAAVTISDSSIESSRGVHPVLVTDGTLTLDGVEAYGNQPMQDCEDVWDPFSGMMWTVCDGPFLTVTGGSAHIVDSQIGQTELVSIEEALVVQGWAVETTGGTVTIDRSKVQGVSAPSGDGAVTVRSSQLMDQEHSEVTVPAFRAAAGSHDVLASTVEQLDVAGTPSFTIGATALIEPPTCTSPGLVSSVGGNWIRGGSACIAAHPDDLSGTDPLLFTVFDSWFATQVPGASSPLVDAIPAGTPGLCDGALSVDQRGQPRPHNGACDIGGVERQPGDP